MQLMGRHFRMRLFVLILKVHKLAIENSNNVTIEVNVTNILETFIRGKGL